MKYYEIAITISPCTDATRALTVAVAADAGCEAFEDTQTGVMAYAQQALFQQQVLDEGISDFPIPETSITYTVSVAEDKDWNEQWEQEGFEPIIIYSQQAAAGSQPPAEDGRPFNSIAIHDGRHLPEALTTQLNIEIDAHLAFGTGTHETTRMICATLLEMNLKGKRVLDCGCGTGILGICALKLGAAECIGYDIDEWSSDNTRHNAVINGVDAQLHALCGDSSVLGTLTDTFDLVLANINRNILLQDMPRFVSVMNPHATLILSGFYESDCALLEGKAQALGLSLSLQKTDGDWACMVFKKQ